MDVYEILNTLKKLFSSFTSREQNRQERSTALQSIPPFKGFQAPFKGSLKNSGGFDPTGKGSVGRIHFGVDLRNPGGTSVYSMAPGFVKMVYNDPKGGNAVTIQHANGYSSYYAHMGTVNVHVGDTINYDTVIGTCGASGNAKGFPHCHWQVWKDGSLIDPASVVSIPPYQAFDAKKEKLWLDGAKAVADNWSLQNHLNSKNNKQIV